jgi:hypothetical protein
VVGQAQSFVLVRRPDIGSPGIAAEQCSGLHLARLKWELLFCETTGAEELIMALVGMQQSE